MPKYLTTAIVRLYICSTMMRFRKRRLIGRKMTFSAPQNDALRYCHPECSEGSEDINVDASVDVHRSIRHFVPQDDKEDGVVRMTKEN